MGTDFTQDAVLHFLQSRGGLVRNSELVSHFRGFVRDHVDRDRNRELFKKFVNSVATVKQIDGVSHVVLRKKFKGYVGGGGGGGGGGAGAGGAAGASGPPRLPPTGRSAEPSPGKATSTPAPPGDSAGKTILPAAGIMTNNNNNRVEPQFTLKQDQQQIIVSHEVPLRPAAAHVLGQTPDLPEPPAPDQRTRAGHPRVGHAPPSEVAPVVRHRGEPGQQVREPVRGRDAPLQSEAGPPLHQDPPLHQVPHQAAPRRMRYRPSYKTAVSHDDDDDDDDEEEEGVLVRPGSTGGAWPGNAPLGDTRRTISASTPCIIDPPAPPSVASSSSSSSSTERMIPKIYVQDVEGDRTPSGHPGWGVRSGAGLRGQTGDESARRSLPLETGVVREVSPHRNVHADRRFSQPAGVQMQPRREPDPGQRARLSSSQGNISLSPEAGPSGREWPRPASTSPGFPRPASASHASPSPAFPRPASTSPAFPRPASPSPAFPRPVSPSPAFPRPASPSPAFPRPASPRGSGWTSSSEDLLARAGKEWGGAKIQEVLHRAQKNKAESEMYRAWHHSTGNLLDYQEPAASAPAFHHSTDRLHDDRNFTGRVLPWHLSTGDLYDDRGDAGSSDGSTSSPPPHLRPGVARRLSSQMRSRMCRSMGTDLDQLLQEEARAAGGSEAARLNRLHMISSSLSLRYNVSSSSLSSCSTPPRSHSMADLMEGTEGKGMRRSLPSSSSVAAPQEGSNRQSLVPLEPREHTWLVKGAAGAWPDIYSLFREDSSLLNRQDFISGFTVLHWIAKHGDHRVLNTLWYGVQKAGLSFDVNARSSCGHTPLHIAAMHDNKNIMRLLVSKFNADVKLRDTAGKKPWQYLSSSTHLEVFQLLGAPARAALGGGGGSGGAGTVDTSWRQEQQQQHQRRRKRHHLSFAPADRRKSSSGTVRVKRSSSIAAFLKHKSLQHFRGQSDASA